jgi:hypothetical protein
MEADWMYNQWHDGYSEPIAEFATQAQACATLGRNWSRSGAGAEFCDWLEYSDPGSFEGNA